jgi:DNA-binding response OmpR family regulator
VSWTMTTERKTKILIIDDDPDLRKLLFDDLDKKGYMVSVAESAEDAAVMMTDMPNFVLLDALLPKMNGFEFCKKIKETKAGKSIVVIIMTGVYKQHFQVKEARLKYQADDYLIKPFTLDRLEEMLSTHLGVFEKGEITQIGLGFKAEGSLTTVPVEKLINTVSQLTKTGMLQLTRGELVRRLYFRRGRIIQAGSNIRSDSLSQVLFDRGKITEEQREQIDTYSKEKRQPREIAVTKLGILRQDEVGRWIEETVKTVIHGLMSWKDGEYQVKLKEGPPEVLPTVDLDAKRVLIQSIMSYVRK